MVQCQAIASSISEKEHALRLQSLCAPDEESSPLILARLIIRSTFRALGLLPLPQRTVVILGSSKPKHVAFAKALGKYNARAIALNPRIATLGADKIIDVLDEHGHVPEYFIPLVDVAQGVADILNTRLQKPANDPNTSMLRRDKFEQQEALRRHGLHAAAQQFSTADADEAVEFSKMFNEVVVKPRNSSAGDGTWLCHCAEEVREVFSAELGKQNVEGAKNIDLIIMECFSGEEWVVNTVSLNGIHKVSDAWRGPSKSRHAVNGAAQFIYDKMYLAHECPELARVVEFTFQVLTAIGLVNGAAHTELAWSGASSDLPRLFEVNPRCAGGVPRVPYSPNQLDILAMSMHDSPTFFALPDIPKSCDLSAAVVFLRAPFDGWLLAESLEAFAALPTFVRFDRGLQKLQAPFEEQAVKQTIGLFSSPGVVVLHGRAEAVEEDVGHIRSLEDTAYRTTS